jgi:hypothetical protein
LQVKADVADPPAVKVTPVMALQTRPVEGLAVSETAPAKLFTEVTVTVDVPELVARILDGATAPRETVKVGVPRTVTGMLTVLDNVLGAVPVVPVIVRVKLAGLGTAVQLTVKTVPETLAVQPVGAALVENETAPEKALIGVNEMVEELLPLPTIGTTTISEDGLADKERSWTVTEIVVDLDSVFGAVPVVPVTGTVNGATPVAQVTDRTALENEAVQPAGTAPAAKVTDPANALMGVTATVELPATVAKVVIAGPAMKKSLMVTETLVVLDSVFGAVPVVPVTGTVNGAIPVEQVTERTAPVKEPEQPDGNTKPAETANVTVPENPLTGVTATIELPTTVARVVIAGPAMEKSTA